MKKVFFLLALLCATVAFGQQVSNSEIANAIQKAASVNQDLSGIQNPDLIYPGQIVWVPIEVQEGDVQWHIFRKSLSSEPEIISVNEQIIVERPEVRSEGWKEPQVQPRARESIFTSPTVPWPILLIVGVFAFALIFMIFEKLSQIRHKTRDQDPVTAGPAQVPGGVRDSGAHSRMNQIAQERFPGARLDIKNIRRGKLSGLATVHYADGKTKKLRLKKVQAYAGEIVVNGQTETIYFLQGCGNDARQGNYMSGNLVFEPDVIINEDGSESSLPTPTPATEIPVVPSKPVRSEYDGQVEKAMEFARKVVTGNPSHEVTIKIPKGEGAFEMTIKAQYPRPEKEKK